MEVKIIPIGNSAGIILPKSLMKEYMLNISDKLSISRHTGGFTLEKVNEEAGELTGPFTGPFEALKVEDDSLWGGPDKSALEYAEELREGRVSSREVESWL